MTMTMPPPPSSFALFPASVPKIAIPNPQQRRAPSLSKLVSPDTYTPTKSPHGESVIIHISHEPAREGQESEYSSPGTRSQTPSPEHERIAVAASTMDGRTPSPAPPMPPIPAGFTAVNTAKAVTKATPLPPPPPPPLLARSWTNATAPGNKSPNASPLSPVVPIRSMFPTYNPGVPLSRQSYYPQRTVSLPRSLQSRPEYNPRVVSPSPFDDPVGGTRTTPSSMVNFPAGVLALRETQFSSQRELEQLWEASNGMEADGRVGSFDLEMCRMDEATFRFGSDAMSPFYTLQTYNTSEIAISRTPPQKRTATVDILLLSIEAPARRMPPYDGLLTFIFPKLAAMLAIDQSTELAARHQLAPTHRDEMQADAVQRAANQEACRLYWRDGPRRYELEHPAIGRNPRDPDFAVSPTTPLASAIAKPVLHINVTSHNTSSPRSIDSAPPVILVTNPNATLTPPSPHNDARHAGIRMSTLPQSDTSEPLASLDLGSGILHIDAAQILHLMPSLYAIDCIVSAMFAVAVADEATNPVMAATDIWSSRPMALSPPQRAGSVFGGGSVKSYGGSAFYATLAEREEAEQEAKLMEQVHKKDVKNKSRRNGTEQKKGWFGREKKAKKAKKPQQIVIGEFDLEKLGHYQAGDRKGEELPAATLSILAVMVWSLKTVVWLLTLMVQVLTWILVNVSRCVTSEKF